MDRVLNMRTLFLKISSILFSAFALSNCASPGLEYTVSEPAYNTEAAKLREVAIMGFSGQHGHTFTSSLDGLLRNTVFEGYPWFEVSPYSSRSGWSGSIGQAVRTGEDLGVQGVWFGDVDTYSSVSPPYREVRSKCVEWDGPFDCERRVDYEVECFDIHAEVSISARLADVAGGYVVADERMSDRDSDRVCRETYYYHDHGGKGGKKGKKHKGDGHGRQHYSGYNRGGLSSYGFGYWEHQDRAERMERRLVAQQAGRLRRVIAPFERTAKARLMETPGLPYTELVTGFEGAISAAKSGNNLASCRQFEALSTQFPDDPSLNFNLGACAEMFGELQQASELYQRAEELAGPMPTEDFLKLSRKAFTRVSDLKLNQSYLTQQLIETGELIPVEPSSEEEETEELEGGEEVELPAS